MDGYAKKMEESSVRHFRTQLEKKKCHKQTNKQQTFQYHETRDQGKF
jgi:hypothetical protein